MQGGLALGVIRRIYYPDQGGNFSKEYSNEETTAPGVWVEAEVEIIEYPMWNKAGGSYGSGETVRVPVPPISGGWDNYVENVPSAFGENPNWSEGQSIQELPADTVVIGFLGGLFNRPVLMGFYPNYGGHPDVALEADARRKYWRYNGVRNIVDSSGNVVLDLVEANRNVTVPAGTEGPLTKSARSAEYSNIPDGGSATVYLKRGQSVRVVYEDENTASGSPENPANQRYSETSRFTISTDPATGEITLETSADLTLKTTGTAVVDASTINLGAAAASGVVRETDAISYSLTAPAGGGAVTGSITHASSSSKVKAE